MIDVAAGMTSERPVTRDELRSRLKTTALAFRGYNVTNTGLTADLLDHPRFGPVMERHLRAAGAVCADVVKRPIDLVAMARERAPATIETYAENLAFVVGAEQAHVEMLADVLEEPLGRVNLAFGYSLGEVSALMATGIFSMETALGILVDLARDTADLAHDVTMGIVFSRGPELNAERVQRCCTEITSRGRGTLAISSILSPNTILLLGQGETVETFKKEAPDVFETKVYVKVNEHRWPPVHTPITWQRSVPNRAGVLLANAPGGFGTTKPRILSCVTGDFGYTDWNARQMLTDWVDHPQLLWPVIEHTLESDVDTVIHVGPEPNIVPATFSRLAQNVAGQLAAPTWAAFGMRAMNRFVNRQWLGRLITREAYLLRAPAIRQVTLEKWLLDYDEV
jgi:[acyl-carrier-protein] S-malonyltransferase